MSGGIEGEENGAGYRRHLHPRQKIQTYHSTIVPNQNVKATNQTTLELHKIT